jgi:hypothetical protein
VYLINGREALASITKVSTVTTQGRGGPSNHLQVDFVFEDASGTQRTGSDTIGTDWVPPATRSVKVQYTPGSNGRVRLAGKFNWLGVGLFLASVCVIGFFGIRLWLEAREATRPRKKANRRYD